MRWFEDDGKGRVQEEGKKEQLWQLKCLLRTAPPGCAWAVSMRFYRPKFCGVLLIRFYPHPQQRCTIGDWPELRGTPRQRPTSKAANRKPGVE